MQAEGVKITKSAICRSNFCSHTVFAVVYLCLMFALHLFHIQRGERWKSNKSKERAPSTYKVVLALAPTYARARDVRGLNKRRATLRIYFLIYTRAATFSPPSASRPKKQFARSAAVYIRKFLLRRTRGRRAKTREMRLITLFAAHSARIPNEPHQGQFARRDARDHV